MNRLSRNCGNLFKESCHYRFFGNMKNKANSTICLKKQYLSSFTIKSGETPSKNQEFEYDNKELMLKLQEYRNNNSNTHKSKKHYLFGGVLVALILSFGYIYYNSEIYLVFGEEDEKDIFVFMIAPFDKEGKNEINQTNYLFLRNINNDYYIGQSRNGRFDGKGLLKYDNKDLYIGNFKNGECHGKGFCSFHNGDKFYGNYTDGIRCGQGVYYFVSGEKYIGEFKDNQINGEGELIDSGGSCKGEFKNGSIHGKFIAIANNGTKIESIMENDKIVGRIKYHFVDGRIFECENKRTGRGKLSYQDGKEFEGEITNAENDYIMFVFDDGTTYEGHWEDIRKF